MQIKKAVRSNRRMKMVIDGPSGSGKTFTCLRLAHQMKQQGIVKKIGVIDTERESASLYSGVEIDGATWEYDTIDLSEFSPLNYVQAIKLYEANDYDCIIIDSLTHAWAGVGGALSLIDQSKNVSKFAAWKDVTPLHQRLIDTIVNSTSHIFGTMRTKTEWEIEKDEKGKSVPVRIGTKAVQRDEFEYEYDLYARMNVNHDLTVEKTRCILLDGLRCNKPGPEFWQPLLDWWKGAKSVAPQVLASSFVSAECEAAQQAINEAKTLDELAAVGKFIKDHVADAGEREQLKITYTAKQNSLKGM